MRTLHLNSPENSACRGGNRRDGRGFSLIELVVVVAIIGLLSAMAIPRFANSIAYQSADAAARRITADIDLARRHAITASVSQIFHIVKGTDPGYQLVGLAHPDHPGSAYIVSLRQDCNGATLMSTNLDTASDLIFDMYGVPNMAAQIVISVGPHQRTINVNVQTGAVTVVQS